MKKETFPWLTKPYSINKAYFMKYPFPVYYMLKCLKRQFKLISRAVNGTEVI